MKLRYLLLIFILLLSGCATFMQNVVGVKTYSFLGTYRVGPVEVEVWRNNTTKLCERRIYLDSFYFSGELPCDYAKGITKEVRGYAFPGEPNPTHTKPNTGTNTTDSKSYGIR